MTPRRRAVRIKLENPRRWRCPCCRNGMVSMAWVQCEGFFTPAERCNNCFEFFIGKRTGQIYDKRRDALVPVYLVLDAKGLRIEGAA